MLTLHYAPKSIASAVAIALEEAGLPYEKALVDFSTGAQTEPAYLAVNPKGRVPALVMAAGILTETGAILEYIATTSGKLMPDTPLQAAKVREVMYYVASTMHVNHAHRFRGHRWANNEDSLADMRAKVPQNMAASCDYLEGALDLAPFVATGISIADPYLFSALSWLKGDGVEIGNYPKLAAFFEMMKDRPSVQTAINAGMLRLD